MKAIAYKVLDVAAGYALIDTFRSAIEANQFALTWARSNAKKAQVVKVTTEACKTYGPEEVS